jgi:serine/threonine protein kinase
MTARASTCDPQRVAAFIAGTLGNVECQQFELHLDECNRCRAELDRQSASPDEWSELQSSLSHGDDFNADASLNSMRYDLACYRKMLAPSDDPRMLGRIGTYEIVGLLGRGGMGIVFKAFEAPLNRYVAIKLLAPLYLGSGAAKQRFVREARSSASVMHENVVGIHAISEWQGVPYLVMTFVRGESLQKRIAHRGALSLREVLRIGLQVAQGLAAAHAQGLMHRDIKPANILLESEVERVKITDFGLARAVDDIRLTGSDTLLGTPEYMSPEQARDEPLDYRTDLFSLGSVLYEACTGRSPFRAATGYGAIRKVIDHSPPPLRDLNPEMPQWLEVVLSRLLAKQPAERYQSAAEVAVVLQQCLAHVEQPRLANLPESVVCRSDHSRFPYSRRFIMSASLAVVTVVGGWMLFAQVGKTPNSDSPSGQPAVNRTVDSQIADNRSPAKRGTTPSGNDVKTGSAVAAQRDNPTTETSPEQLLKSSDESAEAAKSSPYSATAGGYTITLKKADGVARMAKSIKMDPSRLFAKGSGQMMRQSSSANGNGQPQTTTQVTPFGNGIGSGFSSSGGGTSFSSSGTQSGGRAFNPTLAMAFDIQPTGGRLPATRKRKSSTARTKDSPVSDIVEISPKLIATGETGQQLEHQADNPIYLRCLEFEASVPDASTVYLEELQQVSKLASLKGELLVTPGRLLIAKFNGTQKQTQIVDGETFGIESVTQGPNGIQIAVTLPQTTRQKRARTFEEQFKVLSDSMSAFDVTIEDDAGGLHPSVGGGSSGGSAGGSGIGGGSNPGIGQGFNNSGAGGLQGNVNVNPSKSSSQTFGFASLPTDRSIKTIRIKMTDRTGETKSFPFEMKDVSVPYPIE